MSIYPVTNLAIKFNPTDDVQNWGIIEAADISLTDINENITFTSSVADAMKYVEAVGSLNGGEVEFSSASTNCSFVTVLDNALVLKTAVTINPIPKV